ncbi:putative cyclase-associated protein [Cardiosporidium cionae]|uniref:Cyclase-associated protein n=1 Tax=Cardiosporidium cionae TaxID=476202 RepID=A0ABQ7J8J7_9APIC|nr:putative cyclase-associated protein [Cardiosporidium cionae]|eukprot:KAF8820327.1 putative cyclase-associated protein [Cardiosporidium cionae]
MANKNQQGSAPICELIGNVWHVEKQGESDKVVSISSALPKEAVQIQDCQDVTIHVCSKITFATISSCKNCSVIFDGVIASIEVINSVNLKIQIIRRIPSISIDKSSQIALFVSHEGKDVEITTSLSGEMNLNFPAGADAAGEWIEVPIPQQFHHKLVNDRIKSRISDLYSF